MLEVWIAPRMRNLIVKCFKEETLKRHHTARISLTCLAWLRKLAHKCTPTRRIVMGIMLLAVKEKRDTRIINNMKKCMHSKCITWIIKRQKINKTMMKKMMMTMNKMITRTIITCHLVIMSNHYNNSILIFLINNNYSKTLCNKHNPTKITHTQIFNTSSSNNKLYCQINHLTEVSYSSQAISIYLNNKIEMMIVTMMIMSSSNLNP